MHKIIIGTPCYDGKVHAEFMHSVLHTVLMAPKSEHIVYPIQILHDALIQRARNDIVQMAIQADVDTLVFIDSDQAWDPEQFFNLIKSDKDVIGVPIIKKNDTPAFNVKVGKDWKPVYNDEGLLEVEAVGTGFLKISKKALQQVWDRSPEYTENGIKKRMVFDVQLIDGEIVSEDNIFCAKWRDLGGKIYVDPSVKVAHIGTKTWVGDFDNYLKQVFKEN